MEVRDQVNIEYLLLHTKLYQGHVLILERMFIIATFYESRKYIASIFAMSNNMLCIRTSSIEMRRYGDISIQYRYGGSRYVSWPSAIYRDTTLTFVIRGNHHVVCIFCIWRVFRIRSRNIISVGVVCAKCLLIWTPANTALNRDTPCWTGVNRMWPRWFQKF